MIIVMTSCGKHSQRRPRKEPVWVLCFHWRRWEAQTRRFPKETDRTAARKICYKWAEAAEKARRHELTAAQSRKVLSELTLLSSGEQMEFHSVEGWLTDWLASKAGSTAKATLTKYRQVLGSFLDHLAERATSPLASVSPADIATFRDALRSEGRKPETANLAKNVLNGPFEAARRQGVISFNPVAAVEWVTPAENPQDPPPLWSDGVAKKAIVDFVRGTTDQPSPK